MKRFLIVHTLICLLVGVMFINSGCSGCANTMKEFKASTVGIHKRITLYAVDGKAIRQWETTTDTNDAGGSCFFLTKEGKYVRISGTFVIEEIP